MRQHHLNCTQSRGQKVTISRSVWQVWHARVSWWFTQWLNPKLGSDIVWWWYAIYLSLLKRRNNDGVGFIYVSGSSAVIVVAIGCYCLFVETPPQVVAQLLPSRLLLPQHCHTSGAYYCHNLQISKNKCSPEKSSATVGLSGEGTKVVNDPMKPHQLIWQFCSKCVNLIFGQCDNTTGCFRKNDKSKMFVKILIFTKIKFSQLF